MCLAFGVDRLDDVAAKLEEVLELTPPQGLVDKVGSSARSSRSPTRRRRRSRRRRARRSCSPATTSTSTSSRSCAAGRSTGAVHHPPAVITRDRETGVPDVGMYRMQKVDRRSTFMHWQVNKDGRADLLAAPDGRIPVAVALGLDPVTAYSASAPLPKHVGELMVAGFLKGSAVQLVACKTVDLEVPANAEIVLEGSGSTRATPGWRARSATTRATAARGVPALPHLRDHDAPRRDHPGDRRRQAARRGRVAREGDRADLPARDPDERPGLVDYDLPTAGAFHNCVIVSIRKRYQGTPEGDARGVGLGLLSLAKAVVVVDEHVDVHDYEDVFFRVCANVDPKRDVVLADGPIDQLDHASVLPSFGGKIGFDATAKGPDEGAREWPPESDKAPT